MEKTEWFPAEIKPVREGVYERNCGKAKFAYWDGCNWFLSSDHVERAVYYRDIEQYGSRYLDWRGLAENPHAN